jgi:uncharacterized membrane protein YdjX (TVP38/TMEM64 family)
MKKKLLALLPLLAAVAAIVLFAPQIREWLLAAATWAEANPTLAWPFFIVVFTIATVLMMPGWIFMVAAGYLFGVATGGLLAFVANLAGAVAAFFVARTWARDWVKQKIDHSPRFSGFDAAVSKRGIYTVMFARLALLPNNLINYACGVTGMQLRDFMIGTGIGIAPVLVVNVLVGASTMDLVAAVDGDGAGEQRPPLLLIGAIIPVVAVILFLAKRYGPRLADPGPDDGAVDKREHDA